VNHCVREEEGAASVFFNNAFTLIFSGTPSKMTTLCALSFHGDQTFARVPDAPRLDGNAGARIRDGVFVATPGALDVSVEEFYGVALRIPRR
jgi:hypothetical protein